MFKKKEQRCKTCNRIIVGECKTGICPECARKGENGLLGFLGGVVTFVLFIVNRSKKK